MVANIHTLKCDNDPFEELASGLKKAEVRKSDRHFQCGDWLRLECYFEGDPTGEYITGQITHVQRGYGLPDGIVVLSLHEKKLHRDTIREDFEFVRDIPT